MRFLMRRPSVQAVGIVCCFSLVVDGQSRATLDALFVQADKLEAADGTAANRLYESAARQGHTPSMVKLGYRLLYGSGDPPNPSRAFELFTSAANANDLDGQFLMGMSLLEGLGTRKQPSAARAALLRPADAGNQYAQYTLGIMLSTGEGGAKSEAGARRWLERASRGADPTLAARAADFRDKLDARLFSVDRSTADALSVLGFIALVGIVAGAAQTGPGTSGSGGSSSRGPQTGSFAAPNSSRPCRPTPVYRNNPSRIANGDLSSSSIIWVGC